MWRIEDPEIRTGTLDFSSSEQGTHKVSQLYSDDIQLMNAIELVGWEMDEDQFLVCEGCGYVHCKPGDWVSLRVADALILIIPAFGSYVQDEGVNTEYSPPWYLRKRGIPYFDVTTYDELRATNASFPPIERIPALEVWEAILTFQWEAPFQVFGRPPKQFAHRGDLVIASSEGDHIEHVLWIESFAKANLTNRHPVKLRLPTEGEAIVSLYLDNAEFTEWRALAYDGPEMRLMLDSKYVVVTNTAV